MAEEFATLFGAVWRGELATVKFILSTWNNKAQTDY